MVRRTRAVPLALIAGIWGCQGAISETSPEETPSAGAGSSSPVSGSGAGNTSGTGASSGTATTGAAPGMGAGAGSGNTAGTGSTASGSGGTGTIDPGACAQSAGMPRAGLTKLRRMTRSEFNHTVRDLLGVTGTPADALAPDESIGPFYSNAIAPITDLLVQQHDEVAAALAEQAAAKMSTIAGCDLAAGAGCVTQFIQGFGLKAYRRPLETAERDEYLTLYNKELAQGTVQTAFRQIVSTMLASPFFLYHVDIGASGVPSATPVPLTSYEIASRLSYFLWGTMPDSSLFELAASDSLKTDSVLSAQVDRMLADAKAADSIPQFHLQWLGIKNLVGLDKDPAVFPRYSDALATAMAAETATFADFVVRKGDGLMSTLFTAGFSFPEGPLFALYGMTQPAGFVPGTQVQMKAGERAGLLTQAAFLTAHAHRDSTSPIHRGISVRENILCQPLSPPPPGVNMSIATPTAGMTIREILTAHEANPSCGGCHVLIDPIGLVFEKYDGIGAYRTSYAADGSQPIDAKGEVIAGGDLTGTMDGALELGQKLAQSRAVSDCLANQWFRFALGRMESSDDVCSMQAIHDGFAASGNNVRQLLVNIVKSDAFRNVRATAVAP